MTTELLLIDLFSIAFPIYEMSGKEPDPDHVCTQIVTKVRQLAHAHPHAAICCDSGRSFRHDLEPGYKANRDTENRAVLLHQIANACDILQADGFPIWLAPGAEADDIIASATGWILANDDHATVLIASADKDLCQLVSDRVRIKSTHPQSNGEVRGVAEVVAKFGVQPSQMLDWLCLVGDSSDNVKGAWKVGAKTATELLKAHGSLDAMYAAIDKGVVPGITPALRTNLQEFRARLPLVRQLIGLKCDVNVPFQEIAAEREVRAMEADTPELPPMGDNEREMSDAEAGNAITAAAAKAAERIQNQSAGGVPTGPSIPNGAEANSGRASKDTMTAAGDTHRLPQSDVVASVPNAGVSGQLVLAPRDYSQELEPRSMDDAVKLAQRMYESRLFGAYGTPQAVLSTVLAGRELGMPAMASLRAFHIIEGKPQLSAGAIVSLVLKSGKAKYFRCIERTPERATYATQRGDDPEITLAYTIEEGRQAWPKDDVAWKKSGWGRNPADMLVARASSKLARLVYPDVVSGLYAPEEMD